MNKNALKALQSSINHWERLAKGTRREFEIVGYYDCSLCQVFNKAERAREKQCHGCPIFEKTKKQYCRATPYAIVRDALRRTNGDYDSPAFKRAAEIELNFLRSLLPK